MIRRMMIGSLAANLIFWPIFLLAWWLLS